MRILDIFRLKPKPIVVIRIPMTDEDSLTAIRDNAKNQLPDYSVIVIASPGTTNIEVTAMTHKDYKVQDLS